MLSIHQHARLTFFVIYSFNVVVCNGVILLLVGRFKDAKN
jgi:hypothetical protein